VKEKVRREVPAFLEDAFRYEETTPPAGRSREAEEHAYKKFIFAMTLFVPYCLAIITWELLLYMRIL